MPVAVLCVGRVLCNNYATMLCCSQRCASHLFILFQSGKGSAGGFFFFFASLFPFLYFPSPTRKKENRKRGGKENGKGHMPFPFSFSFFLESADPLLVSGNGRINPHAPVGPELKNSFGTGCAHAWGKSQRHHPLPPESYHIMALVIMLGKKRKKPIHQTFLDIEVAS